MVRKLVQAHYQDIHFQDCFNMLWGQGQKTLHWAKEEAMTGLLLQEESLIFQNWVKETSSNKKKNDSLSLMYQSQQTWEYILKPGVL